LAKISLVAKVFVQYFMQNTKLFANISSESDFTASQIFGSRNKNPYGIRQYIICRLLLIAHLPKFCPSKILPHTVLPDNRLLFRCRALSLAV